MLTQFREWGFPLYVCTSKQRHFAVGILETFELADKFTAIYGDKAESSSHRKVDLLANLIGECSVRPDSTWMIGDRIYDIQAAQENHIRSVAAAWGYGSIAEYALADVVATTPADVVVLVSPEGFETQCRQSSPYPLRMTGGMKL